MKTRIALFCAGLGAFASQSFALVEDPTAVEARVTSLVTSTSGVFDSIVPVILAVVGLGVLISFVKMIKKR